MSDPTFNPDPEIFRLVFERSTEGIVLATADGTLLVANPAFCAMTGYEPEEIAGCRVEDLVPAEDLEKAPPRYGLVRGGGTVDSVRRVRCRNGELIHVETRSSLIREDRVLLLFRDTAQRMEARRRLEESEARYRSLVEAGWDVITVVDDRGRFVYASPPLVEVLGYAPSDWVGHEPLEFHHPDDIALARERFREIVASRDRTVTFTTRLRHRDGSYKQVEIRARNLLHQPSVRGLVATFHDISERLEAERALRDSTDLTERLVNAIPGTFFVFDAQGRILRWNEDFERFSGYTDKEIASLTPLDFVDPRDRPKAREAIQRAFSGDTPVTVEARFVTREGRPVPFLFTGTTMDYHGAPCIVGTGIDVSHRKRLEQQLHRAQKLEAVGRLAGGIAHDFNNLMTAILGNAEFLADDMREGDPRREDVEHIRSAAERAATLTSKLLAFARRGSGDERAIHPGRLILSLDPLLRRLLGEDVELVVLTSRDVWPVRVDPAQLEQVLTNLAVNARDAMPHGGRLSIEAANATLDGTQVRELEGLEPGDHVVIAVSDTGVGMDAALLGHVFEPFFTTKGPGEGTGLGLSMVYGIIQDFGGHVDVETSPGKGATFRIYLPRAQGVDADEVAVGDDRPLPRGRERVFLVEDEPLVRNVTVQVLKRQGYEVLSARTAEEALGAIDEVGEVDLLVTDVILPQMSGPEMVERLRAAYPAVPVLYISGYTQDPLEPGRTPGHGPVDFLPKPFQPSDLARRVRAILDEAV